MLGKISFCYTITIILGLERIYANTHTNNYAKIKVGESIAIFGCGGVGSSLIQLARLSGCYPIIGVDIYENKLKHAVSLGATHTVKSDLVDFEKRVLESNSNSKIDVCIDNTGIHEIIEKNSAANQQLYRLKKIDEYHYHTQLKYATLQKLCKIKRLHIS